MTDEFNPYAYSRADPPTPGQLRIRQEQAEAEQKKRREQQDALDAEMREGMGPIGRAYHSVSESLFGRAWEDQTLYASLLRWWERPTEVDPTFRVTNEMIDRQLPGVPLEHMRDLFESRSEAEFMYRARNLRSRLKTREDLANAGLGGFAASIGSAILDPAFLVAYPVATAGLFGKASQTGLATARAVRAKAALRGAGIAVAVDTPLELLRLGMDDMATAEQMTMNIVSSVGLGGALGGAFPSTAGFSGWKKQLELEQQRIALGVLDNVQNASRSTGDIYGPFRSLQQDQLETSSLRGQALFAEARARGVETHVTNDAGRRVFRPVGDIRADILRSRRFEVSEEGQIRASLALAADDPDFIEFDVSEMANQLNRPDPENTLAKLFGWGPGSIIQPLTIKMSKSKNPLVRKFFSGFAENPQGTNKFDLETLVDINNGKAMQPFFEKLVAIKRTEGDAAYAQFTTNLADNIRTGQRPSGIQGEAYDAAVSFFDYVTKYAKRQGVEGFESFQSNFKYVPREASSAAVRQLIKVHDEDTVVRLIEESLRKGNPNWSDAKIEGTAKGWLKYAMDPENYTNARLVGGRAADRVAALRRTLANTNLTDDEAKDLADLLLPKGNDPHLGMTHRRLKFDESHSVVAPDGSTVKFSDLLENDMLFLMEKYAARVIGSAEFGKYARALDIDSVGAVPTLKEVVAHLKKAGDVSDAETDAIESIYRRIMGLSQRTMLNPAYMGKNTQRAVRAAKDYSFINSMGRVGIAQMPEIATSVVSAGLGAMLKSMPALRNLRRMAANGQLTDETLQVIQTMTQVGDMLSGGHVRTHKIYGDMGVSAAARGASRVVELGRRVTAGDITIPVPGLKDVRVPINPVGIAPIDEMLRMMHVHGTLQSWVGKAYKVKNGKPVRDTFWSKSRKRFKTLGLDDKDIDDIMEQLSKPDVVQVSTGLLGKKIAGLNLENMPKVLRDKLTLALRRDADRVIQRNKGGNLSGWMQTPEGGLISQFRTFMVVATQKQLVYNLRMMDGKAFATFGATMYLGYLGYTLTTYQNATAYAEGPERDRFLRESFTNERKITAAISRAGYSGIFPALFDTGYSMIHPDREMVFNNYRTSGLGLGLIDGIPAVSLGKDAYNSSIDIFRSVLDEVSGGTAGSEMTDSQVRRIFRLLPLKNAPVIQQLYNSIEEELTD